MDKLEFTTPIADAPTHLNDAELADWALRQFPNAQGTLGMVLRRFKRIAGDRGMECDTRYGISIPDSELSHCPCCGTAVQCVSSGNNTEEHF